MHVPDLAWSLSTSNCSPGDPWAFLGDTLLAASTARMEQHHITVVSTDLQAHATVLRKARRGPQCLLDTVWKPLPHLTPQKGKLNPFFSAMLTFHVMSQSGFYTFDGVL